MSSAKKTKSKKNSLKIVPGPETSPLLLFHMQCLKNYLLTGTRPERAKKREELRNLFEVHDVNLKRKYGVINKAISKWNKSTEITTGVPEKEIIRFIESYPLLQKEMGQIPDVDLRLFKKLELMSIEAKEKLDELLEHGFSSRIKVNKRTRPNNLSEADSLRMRDHGFQTSRTLRSLFCNHQAKLNSTSL